MTGNIWDQDGAVALLRILWDQGLSASQISARLATIGVKVSRNAVIGKVTRLGLQKRITPRAAVSLENRKRASRAVDAVARAERVAARKALKDQTNNKARRAPPKDEASVRFIDHRDFHECAMFCDGESGDYGFVCGKPAVRESVYCQACLEITQDPAARRARKLKEAARRDAA